MKYGLSSDLRIYVSKKSVTIIIIRKSDAGRARIYYGTRLEKIFINTLRKHGGAGSNTHAAALWSDPVLSFFKTPNGSTLTFSFNSHNLTRDSERFLRATRLLKEAPEVLSLINRPDRMSKEKEETRLLLTREIVHTSQKLLRWAFFRY